MRFSLRVQRKGTENACRPASADVVFGGSSLYALPLQRRLHDPTARMLRYQSTSAP